MEETIDSFRGPYSWLSNFYNVLINYKGIEYKSVEAAYQAQKTRCQSCRKIFSTLDPAQAKTLGNNVILRDDWEGVKLSIMEDLCNEKFSIPYFRSKLYQTGSAKIVEGSYWHDTYWGICKGVGENHLGKIIMKIRQNI